MIRMKTEWKDWYKRTNFSPQQVVDIHLSKQLVGGRAGGWRGRGLGLVPLSPALMTTHCFPSVQTAATRADVQSAFLKNCCRDSSVTPKRFQIVLYAWHSN